MDRPSATIKEEDFDWEEHGNSLFDEKNVSLLGKLVHAKVVVEGIHVSNVGDITILFSNRWTLDVFIDSSNEDECRRIFRSGDPNSHMVITGDGIEED